MEEKNEIKDEITQHVQEKVTVMEEKAKAETIWYKKLGFYVAAAVGAVVVQLINLYGNDVIQIITEAIKSCF